MGGPELQYSCTTAVDGATPHLRLHAGAKTSRTRGWIRVLAAANTPYGELIRVLDTLRERTDKPPGCTLRTDRSSGVWAPVRRGVASCMPPFPILGQTP